MGCVEVWVNGMERVIKRCGQGVGNWLGKVVSHGVG